MTCSVINYAASGAGQDHEQCLVQIACSILFIHAHEVVVQCGLAFTPPIRIRRASGGVANTTGACRRPAPDEGLGRTALVSVGVGRVSRAQYYRCALETCVPLSSLSVDEARVLLNRTCANTGSVSHRFGHTGSVAATQVLFRPAALNLHSAYYSRFGPSPRTGCYARSLLDVSDVYYVGHCVETLSEQCKLTSTIFST